MHSVYCSPQDEGKLLLLTPEIHLNLNRLYVINKKVLNHSTTRDEKSLQYLGENDVFSNHFLSKGWGLGTIMDREHLHPDFIKMGDGISPLVDTMTENYSIIIINPNSYFS